MYQMMDLKKFRDASWRALFGSLERFIGILIENYAGKLPFWLSPLQAVVCSITEDNNDYVKNLFKDLFKEV